MDAVPNNKLFQHNLTINRDAAIAFVKSVGFEETPESGVFARDTERSAAQAKAGARALVQVNIEALISSRKAWRLFVQRWSRKLAAR